MNQKQRRALLDRLTPLSDEAQLVLHNFCDQLDDAQLHALAEARARGEVLALVLGAGGNVVIGTVDARRALARAFLHVDLPAGEAGLTLFAGSTRHEHLS